MSRRFFELGSLQRVLAVGLIVSGAAVAVLLVGLTRGSGAHEPSEPLVGLTSGAGKVVPTGPPTDCASIQDPSLDWGAADGGRMGFVLGGGSGPGVSPAALVRGFPVIAHVRVPADRNIKCEDLPESEGGRPFVTTEIRVEIIEYIKGGEGKSLNLVFWGGVLNGYPVKVEGMVTADELPPGGEAVVALSPSVDGVWFVADAYAFDGAMAKSEMAERELPVDQLLDELREAAKN
ncbi:MAG TPA: hypothetical protein VIT93_01620 [Dehalococcoidia bacterium]